MFSHIENPKYFFLSLAMTMSSAALLFVVHKFLRRPSYECRYVYNKKIMRMVNSGDDPCKCDKEKYPCGNYMDNIESFVIKDEEL